MSDPQKLKNRRSFTAEFKVQVVLELLRGDYSLSGASDHYQIKDSVLSRWKQEFLERAPQLFSEPSGSVASEVEDLKKLVGEQTVELSILKKAYGISTLRQGRKS
jgi:putative transposase